MKPPPADEAVLLLLSDPLEGLRQKPVHSDADAAPAALQQRFYLIVLREFRPARAYMFANTGCIPQTVLAFAAITQGAVTRTGGIAPGRDAIPS